MNDFSDKPGDFWGRFVLIGGAGCLVFILAISLFFLYGTSRCCGDIEERNLQVIEPVQDFLDLTASGELEQAYEGMADGFRARYSKNDLRALIRDNGDLLVGGEAKMLKVRPKVGEPHLRYMVVQIVNPATLTVKGVVTFTLNDFYGGSIEDITLGDKVVSPALQDQALATLQRHLDALAQKDDAAAYLQLDASFAGDIDREAFSAFIDSQAELFRRPGRVRLRSLKLALPMAEAEVTLSDPDSDEVFAELVYGLHRSGGLWLITSVQTLSATPTAPSSPAQPPTPPPSDDQATEQAPTEAPGESPEEEKVEP